MTKIIGVYQKVDDSIINVNSYIESRVTNLEKKCVSATVDKEGFVILWDGTVNEEGNIPDNAVTSSKDTEQMKTDIQNQFTTIEENINNLETAINNVEGNITTIVGELVKPAERIPLAPSETGGVGISDKYAREDHKHPYQKIDLSGVVNYELCEFYFFRHPTLKPGFQPAQGGLLENAATLYPEAWAYLQTTEGQKLCKTEAEWQAMTQAIWHTNADGTTVGWNGIGGAPFYALHTDTGALRLPDLRGMYAEAAGFDSLGVGGTHGDGMRRLFGRLSPHLWADNTTQGILMEGSSGVFTPHGTFTVNNYNLTPSGTHTEPITAEFNNARQSPISNKNQPRAWGTLACVYLGQPAS